MYFYSNENNITIITAHGLYCANSDHTISSLIIWKYMKGTKDRRENIELPGRGY